MSDPRKQHGSPIDPVTRELRYLSVSSLQKFDASGDTGCNRKWWYDYVEKRKEPETASTKRGHECHEAIARYLKTGNPVLPSIVARGLHMVELPGPDLFVEQPLLPARRPTVEEIATGNWAATDWVELLDQAVLRVAGIPLIGAIDLMHERRTNKGASEITDTLDPPNTVEVVDWKFPGSTEHMKLARDLPRTIQMAGYANYVFAVAPSVELVRLSHGVMPVKGAPVKNTIRVDRDGVRATWEHAESLARSARHVAREVDPDKVEANTKACKAFRRDCIHKTYCRAAMHNSLASLVGARAADQLFQINKKPGEITPMLQNLPGALMSHFQQQPAQAAAPAATGAPSGSALSALMPQAVHPAAPQMVQGLPPGVTMQVGQPHVSIAPGPMLAGAPVQDVAAAVAALQAQEAQQRAAQQQIQTGQAPMQVAQLVQQSGPPTIVAPPSLLDVCGRIQNAGRGFPSLAGEAAVMAAAAGGQQVAPGTTFAGQGELGQYTISTVAELNSMADQLAPAPQAQPIAAAPPQVGGLLAPEAPSSQPSLASAGQPAAPAATSALSSITGAAAEAESKKTRSRKKADPAPTAPADTASVGLVTSMTQPAPQAAPSSAGLMVLVDCSIVLSKQDTISLEPHVESLLDAICKQYGVDDVRCGGEGSPIGYSKWKGVIGAAVRDIIVPSLAHGMYTYATQGSEIGVVVAEALRSGVLRAGGTFAQGAR